MAAQGLSERRASEPPPPPYTQSQENTTRWATTVQTTTSVDISQRLKPTDAVRSVPVEGKPENAQASDVQDASFSDIQDNEQPTSARLTDPQASAAKREDPKTPTVTILSALADTRKTAKVSPRTQREEFKDEEAVPGILDPKISMSSAGLWEK
ncbi:hypothetical protein GLAREA_05816 [Glarea lozoyensis ATCC 20868]|uniref:Uncharacterized protein n=1 Tax=Glarea lozoyensis (strain ATCC 20868 / MF5171) TaxID=1116229 RepID=S3EDW7_GLAL2|nr:uncharacterized protein GLAREA_05816 [Glarea lozoyensis ATCC 20868]EPE36478.1 hypothetical protein GLAREA_05816 [Glarea lozoyensis ATCC 20868]